MIEQLKEQLAKHKEDLQNIVQSRAKLAQSIEEHNRAIAQHEGMIHALETAIETARQKEEPAI